METDLKSLLDQNSISRLQYATIFICFLMNVLDGMDVLVISYAAPAIAQSWGIGPEALGMVFSSGLIGMTIGALFLAPFADQIGRKTLIIISCALMGLSIYLTSYANSVSTLIMFRLISGVGIGSMLATTAALAAEYTPHRTRDFWVSLVISGYPVGAVLSGLVAAKVITEYGWPQMFQLAGVASLITLPLIFIFLSESIEFYIKKQPQNALEKANQLLNKMGLNKLSALPEFISQKTGSSVSSLLKNEYRIPTFQLWTALFLAFATLYFLTSWIPKLASNTGLSMALSIYAGTIFNVGAFFGIITQGYFSSRFGSKKTIGLFFILTALLMAFFGLFIGSDLLLVVFGFLGFGIQGGFVGLYAVSARMYPTEFRTTGVGWSIGIGRLGGIIGPAAGGILIGMGLSMVQNFLIYAVPTVLAGIMTLYISSKEVR